MEKSLTLLTVHAHPDDESSKGPATVAILTGRGIRSVLVTCTGGEEGDINNPAMDRPEVKENLSQIRRAELDAATKIIGYSKLYLLGYRDSGMPGVPANFHPDSFAQAPVEEAGDKLIGIIRREMPQVVVTYHEDQSGYPHPDHLKVHDISVYAFDRSGDSSYKPELGPPHQISKLYYTAWASQRTKMFHDKFIELGLESPFSQDRLNRPGNDEEITTRIDVRGYYKIRKDALLAHATQIDPTSNSWFGLPDSLSEDLWPYEDYILARSNVGETESFNGYETDLFAGISDHK
ncbi:MAG: mycothiol conjugate amidase Mca [Acidimicrobiaceae bacterium]|nr:mycothiol conjugate amidase Mca [Acidimicrobiaceae bacterium]